MEKLDALLLLQQEKLALFEAYEKATGALLEGDAEACEHYIIQRGELANQIDDCTQQIGRLCEQMPYGELLLDAALSRCNYQDVPPEFRAVYTSGQDLRTVVNRILQAEETARQHLAALRDDAKTHIKDNQHLPKIKKYLSDLGDTAQESALKNGKA